MIKKFILKTLIPLIFYIIIIAIITHLIISMTEASDNTESWYRDKWTSEVLGLDPSTNTEIRLYNDNNEYVARADIISDHTIYEVDFASKWQEGISQSLYYHILTNKYAGLVLIIEDESDYKYVDRAKYLINELSLPIRIFLIVNINNEWR